MRKSASSRFPIFAFRLHQFFTRGDTVWATLEPEDSRHLEISKLVSKPGEPDKPLFPLVFCRQCGTAYYRVSIKTEEGRTILSPREDRREADRDAEGYLYTSETAPWPTTEGPALLDRLPSFLKIPIADGGERVRPDARDDVPSAVFVDPTGRMAPEGDGIAGALIRRNFLFCLEPSCGVAYTKIQRSERLKLGTLGVDNRSTATTILAVRSLIELQGDATLQSEARKLLSFTDNRQDASLQAGHFNDFAQVALLRSALHKATESKGSSGLTHSELSRSLFEALSLRFDDYAADPDVRGPARDSTNEALRRVINYYVYRDLQRGWRVTAPNLEDCGLLHFNYDGLTGAEGLIEESELWGRGIKVRTDRTEQFVETPVALQACPLDLREEILRTLLDVLRRGLAVKVDVLDPQKQRDLVEQTNPRLLEGTVWYLEDTRELVKSDVAYPRSRQAGDFNALFISSHGGFGRYLKRVLLPHIPTNYKFNQNEVDSTIRFLFLALKRYGIVEQVRNGEVPGYQINPDAMRWIAGSGEVRPVDRTRMLDAGEIPPEVNRYFVECYRRFVDLNCVLEAREHTAQVTSEDREDLAWNPTRHEQREGRVDRFGQEKEEVRAVTYYGADNRIDGVILDVLIRKHKSIKSDLGVTVAVPGSSEQIAEALFEGALFREKSGRSQQMSLAFIDNIEPKKKAIHAEWENARDREKAGREGRSRFAQHALSPEAVAAELESVRAAIGRNEDVGRFFHAVLQSANVPVQSKGNRVTVYLSNEAPRALRQAIGRDEPFTGRFDLPLEEGDTYLGRASPVIEGLAGWTLDQALDAAARDDGKKPPVASRCGVVQTSAVAIRTTLLLARFRYHLQIAGAQAETILCEEIVPLACTGPAETPQWLTAEDGERLLAARPERSPIQTAIDQQLSLLLPALPRPRQALAQVAGKRSAEQLAAHERVCEASRTRGRVTIQPVLPVDILGAYVVLPIPSGSPA